MGFNGNKYQIHITLKSDLDPFFLHKISEQQTLKCVRPFWHQTTHFLGARTYIFLIETNAFCLCCFHLFHVR